METFKKLVDEGDPSISQMLDVIDEVKLDFLTITIIMVIKTMMKFK